MDSDMTMSKQVRNLLGQRFGKRTVVKYAGTGILSHSNRARWVVRCDCGREDTVYGMQLLAGHGRSCRACATQAVRQAKQWSSNPKRSISDVN